MQIGRIVLLIVAIGGGILGGTVATSFRSAVAQQPAPVVVRATRVELIDSWGKTRAILGVSGNGTEASVSFLAENGGPILSFGAVSPDRPFLRFMGPDGSERVRLNLNNEFNPALLMRDKKGWKLHLGAIGGDVVETEGYRASGGSEADWTLMFADVDFDNPAAQMAMGRRNGAVVGSLRIENPSESLRVPTR